MFHCRRRDTQRKKNGNQKEDWEHPILFETTATVLESTGLTPMPLFLTLNELEASACFLAAVLLAFLDARIAGHETASSELFAESLVIFDECA